MIAGVLGLLAVVFAIAASTPSTADAFVGESLVLNPAKTDLTTAAKSILSKPTFLTTNVGEAGALGGVAESSSAAGLFSAGGILPALGAVTAFGVGTIIGSEICGVLGIEGCWYFGSKGADPSVSGGSWLSGNPALAVPPIGGTIRPPDYSAWWWKNPTQTLTASVASAYTDAPVSKPGCAAIAGVPGGNSGFFAYELVGGLCARGGWYRWHMQNRTLDYHATDDPSISNYSFTASPEWSTKMAAALKNHEGDVAGRVGQKIASEISGSGVSNPYALTVTIPDCDELAWGACKAALEGVELVPELDRLTWSAADLDIPPDTVVELAPDSGSELEKGKTVVVTVNPEEGDMPLVLPEPEEGETYSHYAARLNPGLSPSRVDVGEAFVDPSLGPNAVVRTVPEPGTRFDPSTSHDVDVQTNPSDAPIPLAAWVPPSIPAIDMSPLSGIPSPCTVFPFGLFCWVGEALAQFNTSGTCPGFSAPVADTGSDFDVTLCGETSETILSYLRPALLLAFIVGCGFMFARGTKAIGDD